MNRITLAAFAAVVALTTIVISPPALAAANSPAPAKPAKPLHISKGATVKITDYLVPGKTVVFDFYSDFCGPCVQFAPILEQLHEKRADVVVVKVDINRPGVKGIDWKSPVAQQYQLNSIPHLKVYGPDGKLMAEDRYPQSQARRLVMSWVQ